MNKAIVTKTIGRLMSCRTAGSYGRALKAGLLVLLLTVGSILPAAAYTLPVVLGENGETTTDIAFKDVEAYTIMRDNSVLSSGEKPVLSVADVMVVPGETAFFAVNLIDGKADTYCAMQFDAYFPTTGFTTTGDYTVSSLWKNAQGTVEMGTTAGKYNCLFYQLSNKTIQGSVVDSLVTVSFKVDESVPYGEYEVTLKAILVSNVAAENCYEDGDLTFKVKVVDQATFDENANNPSIVTYALHISSEGGGTISYSTPTTGGIVNANEEGDFIINGGDDLQLTFTPSSDAYKVVAAIVNGTDVLAELTPDNAYNITNVTSDITVHGAFDIAIKDGAVMTEVIDGIEWTYTVTDEANKVCHLGAVDSGMNSITAVPTTTEAESITIPSVINGYTVKGLAVEAFRDCSGLTGQLNIPSTVTFIGDMAFMGTHFSGPLTLPEGLNDLCSYSFYNLYNLTGDLVIPESLTVLPADAFYNCMGFTSLTLPSTVTKIWTGCFGRMLGLTQITCLATTPPELSKDDVFTTYDVPLFVPAESVDAYKAAQYWSNFTNIYAIGTELNHTLTVASSGGGKIVGAIKNLTGEIYSEFESNPDSDDPVEFPVTVPVGYSVEMTFTPKTGYYLNEVTKNGSENLTSQVVDNKLTLTDINEDMKVSAVFERITLLLQLASPTSHGTVSWEVNDVSGTGITYGVVDNSVEDIPVPYGSTVTLTFNYDHTQYGLSQLTRNGVSVLADVLDDAYIISNYTANDTIVVNYTEMAAEAYAALSDGNTVLTFYYDKQKTARGGMSVGPFASEADNPWYTYSSSITTVVFDESFAGYTALSSTAHWFYDCENLTTVTGISNLKTDNVTDMKFMFHGCSSLPAIDLSGFNTANVQSMQGLFFRCESLTSLDLSSFNTGNVTDMGAMFSRCISLANVNVSSFNTSKVTDMRLMFNQCSSLTTVDLSGFNTSLVADMAYMFSDCSNLQSIFVGSGWSTAAVESSSGTFNNCTALVGGMGTVFDANNTGAAYAHIDGGAANPGYLTPQGGYVEAPTFTWNGDDLTMTTGTDGATIYYTMVETSSPTAAPTAVQYTSPVTVTSDVLITAYAEKEGMAQSPSTVLNYPYTAWKALADAIADAQTVSAQAATNDNVTDTQRTELTDMINLSQGMYDARVDSASVINQQTTNLTTLTTTIQQLVNAEAEPYAVLSNDGTVVTFYYDKKKQERGGMDINNTDVGTTSPYGTPTAAVFDASFDAYRPTSTAHWFEKCNSLTTITGIEYLHTDDVTDMKYMFYDCSSLTSLDVSGFNTANVTDMGLMFVSCSGLTSLDVSNFNTANVGNMQSMFNGCSGLTSLNVTNFNTANVTNMAGMFMGCSGLTSLDLSNFNTVNVTSMLSMFHNCSSLTSLDLSNFNTANVTNMGEMFRNCSSLTSIDLSDFNTSNVTGMYNMFDGCSGLKTIYVGEGWSTASVTISEDMFADCTALVGGKGTVYDANHIDAAYAHIDGGAANPGYFTDINAPTTYTVTVDVFGGGSVTAGGETITEYTDYNREVSVDAGGSLLLTFTPAADHRLATVLLDGTDVTSQVITDSTGVSYYTLTSIYDDHTVTATFVDATIDVVGNTDFSSAWWTAFSSNYEIPADHTLHMQFTNHSDKVNNWDNWVLMCTADSTRTPEYFALRADSYGWGDYYNGDGLSSNWTDWDAFREGMDGALVDLTVRRWGSEVTVTTVAKAADDTEYVQTLTTTIDPAADQSINVFLTVENAYLEIYKNSITLTPSEAPAIPEAYAVLSNDGTVVTFYYDTKKTERGGIDINNSFIDADATSPYGTATTAVFDASFDAYRPTSTSYWFMKCSSLTTITGIGYLHTDDVTNMRYMFRECSGLNSLDVSNFNTGNLTNMYGMFAFCSGLTSLDVSNFNTANVTNMGGMFYDCSSLTSLDVSNFNTDNVTDMSVMFYDCSSLTSLDVSNFNTANVTNMGSMFYDCSSLTSLDVSNFNTSNVTNMYCMFYDCSSLTSLDVSNFNTSNVTNMYCMFSGCFKLTSLDVSNFNTSNVTNMYCMFWKCSSLTSLDVSGFNTANVMDMHGMFGYCSGLTSLDVSNFNTANVTDMEAMFRECSFLTSLDVINFNTEKVTTMCGMFNGCSSLTSLDVSNFNTANVTDMEAMFRDCSVLTSLDVINFNTEKVTTMCGMFNGCSNLTSLDVSNFNTTNVTDMYGMFWKCSSLTSLDVSGFNTANVTDMAAMFGYCSGLTSLDVSNFNTTNVTDMTAMFRDCSVLTSLDVINFNTEKVTTMCCMFYGCDSLPSLGVSNFNTTNVTDMGLMFAYCSGLTSLDVSNFNTAFVTDIKKMFRDCSNLKTIYVGEGWSTEKVTNSDSLFINCTALVGCMGTVYDADHVDAAYAHIDGGTANPGYFSPLLQKGDANGDGDVNIADAVATVTNILGEPATGNFYRSMADMNGDDEIDIFDVTMIVNAALNANNPGGSRYMAAPSCIDRIAAEDVMLTAKADRLYLDIDRTAKFTAFQFDVTLPKGTELLGVKLGSAITDHQLMFVKRGDGQYRVVGLSMSNQVIDAASSRLIQLQLSDPTADRNVQVSNVLFVNPQAKDATGIGQHPTVGDTQDGGYYDMNGRYMGTDKQQLSKGMYIKNHKKVIIK